MTGHGPCRNRLTSSWLSRPASGSELVVSKPSCARPGSCGRVCCPAAGWFRHGSLVPHGPAQPASHTKAGPARIHDPAPHGKIEGSVGGGPVTSGPAHLGVLRGVGGADDGGTGRQGRHHNHRATGGGVDTELGIEEAVEEVTDAHDSMLRREIPCVQYPFVR